MNDAAQQPALVWCPFPDRASAERVADALLDEGMIACANIFSGMVSLYRWNGSRGRGEECGALFKTNSAGLDSVIARISALHPYEQPAILGWRCDAATPETAAWLAALGT